VCRKCYIHPLVVDAYMGGDVIKPSKRRPGGGARLSPQESAVVALIDRWSPRLRSGQAPRPRSRQGRRRTRSKAA
jgi:hypothetical protein